MWLGAELAGSIKNWPALLMFVWWLSVFSHFALDACGLVNNLTASMVLKRSRTRRTSCSSSYALSEHWTVIIRAAWGSASQPLRFVFAYTSTGTPIQLRVSAATLVHKFMPCLWGTSCSEAKQWPSRSLPWSSLSPSQSLERNGRPMRAGWNKTEEVWCGDRRAALAAEEYVLIPTVT